MRTSWDDLTDEQRMGMDQTFWDGLEQPQQEAFLEGKCTQDLEQVRLWGTYLCWDHLLERDYQPDHPAGPDDGEPLPHIDLERQAQPPP